MQKTTVSWSFYIQNINKGYSETDMEINPGYIHEFFIIESIENMFLIGEMTLVDTSGFMSAISFTGNESIKIVATQLVEDHGEKVKSIDLSKIIEFDIWNVDVTEVTLTKKTMKIHLIQKGAYNIIAGNRSKGYSQKLISEIITDILEKNLGIAKTDFDIEKTNERIDFTIPFWPPNLAIRHLIRKAKREKSPKEGGFLFFTAMGGKERDTPIIKCITFASLFEQKIDINDPRNKYYLMKVDSNQYFINTIKDIIQPTFGNKSMISSGLTGKRYFGVDYNTNKNIIQEKQLYTDYFKKSATLGKVSLLPTSIDDYHGEVTFTGGTLNQVQSKQSYSFRVLLESCLRKDAVVEGSLERQVGQVIFLEATSENPDDLYNRPDTGKWLIKDITHYLAHGSFQQRLVLIKDAFEESDLKGHEKK